MYRIAIPTYKRYNTLWDSTLNYLSSTNVPSECIDIFVASQDELEKYQRDREDNNYNWIIGKPGKAEISNFIMNYYPSGKCVVCLDDDIEYIYDIVLDMIDPEVETRKIKRIKITDLNEYIITNFETAKITNSKLWGISVQSNDNWLIKRSPVSYRIQVCGAFFGMIIDPTCRIHTCIDDAERSLYYWNKYSNNLIFPRQSFFTKKQWNEGGLFEERTRAKYREDFTFLKDAYPEIVLDLEEKQVAKYKSPFKIKYTRNKKKYVDNL